MALALRFRKSCALVAQCGLLNKRSRLRLGSTFRRTVQPLSSTRSSLCVPAAALATATVGIRALHGATAETILDENSNVKVLAGGKGRVAAVLGATGAVGKEVVAHLCERDQWSKVVVLNRRHVEYESEKVEVHIIDLSDCSIDGKTEKQCAAILMGVDAIFNTMGIGAASKVDEASLRSVDVEIPSAVFRGAKTAGVRHASILSAVGADKGSDPDAGLSLFGMLPKTRAGGNLYNHCKGLVEDNVRLCGFSSISTFRPAALIGTPNTPAIVASISPFLDAIVPAMYKSSNITSLALAMVVDAEASLAEAGHREKELSIFEGERLQAMYDT